MSPEEVRSAIREYTRKRVDFLKYISDGDDVIIFSLRQQKAIVEEGHRAGADGAGSHLVSRGPSCPW